MNPIYKAFFGLRISKCFVLFLFLFFSWQWGTAQLVPGIRANGIPVNQGDTVVICKGTSVAYLSTAQNFNTLNWSFDVGTGTPLTSTAVAPTSVIVPYGVAGTFISWQYIVAGGNRDSTFIYVRVNDIKPTAGFNFSPDSACGNIQVDFTSVSTGNGLSYNWTFEIGATSTLQNPGYQFLNAIGTTGTVSYPVKLVVTND